VPVIYAGPDRNFVTDQFEPASTMRSTFAAAVGDGGIPFVKGHCETCRPRMTAKTSRDAVGLRRKCDTFRFSDQSEWLVAITRCAQLFGEPPVKLPASRIIVELGRQGNRALEPRSFYLW
jgi:hypothetical protein